MNKIDINDYLIAFKKHLNFNERTILSAKYGDGKTYFINQFKEEYKEEYEFITLYPVNYQVADNKEIFEYIKRDILIQMVMKNMIDSDCHISEAHYLQYYLMNNHFTLLQDIIQILPALGIGNEGLVWTKLLDGFKGLTFLNDQKNKYDQFKKEIESKTDIELAESFCDSFSNEKGGYYELDMISEIIIQSIKKFKKGSHKRLVLIIEDMDRLDPAHLFRILNIFSAHLDRYNIYKNTKSLTDYVLTNKFGFDNIITVFDYDNTKKIFAHFYGENANFEGYINKFTTGYVFHYSIDEIAKQQLNDLLKNKCDIEINDFQDCKIRLGESKTIYEMVKQLSVRDIQRIISKYEENIKNEIIYLKTGFAIYANNTLTNLISILKLIGIDKKEIKQSILNLPDITKLNCIGCYLLDDSNVSFGSFNYNGSFYTLSYYNRMNPINHVTIIKLPQQSGRPQIDDDQLVHFIDKAFEYV